MLERVVVVLAIVGLTACSTYSDWRMQSELSEMRRQALARIDIEKCSSEGGKIEGVGMFGTPSCVHYYADGGKSCLSGSDCEGYCFNQEVMDAGVVARGMCERSEHDSFGCFSRVESGKVASSMCMD